VKQPQKNKLGVTRGKLALVAVLSVVLVVVIVQQLPEGAAQPDETAAAAAELRPTNTKSEAAIATSNAKSNADMRPWPTSDVATAIANDPFALPEWVDRPEAVQNDNANLLADLQEQGASIVMIGTGEKSARVGDHRVRVGDVLDGYRITDITDQGIVLDKLDNR